MSEMIERVARAICRGQMGDPDRFVPVMVTVDFGDAGMGASATSEREPAWHSYRAVARAAIEAMREPTEAMLKEGVGELPNEGGISASPREADAVWQAMINAALSPVGEQK